MLYRLKKAKRKDRVLGKCEHPTLVYVKKKISDTGEKLVKGRTNPIMKMVK